MRVRVYLKRRKEKARARSSTRYFLWRLRLLQSRKSERDHEREREREGRTLFFIFFWPFENSFVFCPFSKKRERVRLRPPFFECAVVFSRRRPTKQRVRSKGVVENETKTKTKTKTMMRNLLASALRRENQDKVLLSFARGVADAPFVSSSTHTQSASFSAQRNLSNRRRRRRSFSSKEGKKEECNAIKRRTRRIETTLISTRGFAAKSSDEVEVEKEGEEEETTTTSTSEKKSNSQKEEEEEEEEVTTDFAKLNGNSVRKYITVSKSQLRLDQCKAIEREFAFTGSNGLLYRKCDDALREIVARHERGHLRGYRGCGKSVSLAILVLRERALGSLVVYLPRTSHLVTRSSYQKHGEGAQEDLWDTPDAARVFLHAVSVKPNEMHLRKIKTSGDKQSLLDVVKSGLEKGDQHVTQIAIDIIDELVKQKDVRVVFAFDEQNALYGPSDMHEVKGPRSRKNIHTDRLRLALKLRSCVPTANGGRYIACDSTTNVGSSNPVFKSKDENVFDFEIPKFNVSETHALLKHYEEVGKCSQGINKEIAMEFKALTNGKVKEIQEHLMFQNA